MSYEKFIRFTGMFKMKDNPKCSTATPSAEKLREFVNVARAALADDRLIQFSFWDNGTKPNQFGKVMDTLNYREVDAKKERQFTGGSNASKRPEYTPKPKPIPPEDPVEEAVINFESEAY